MSAFMISQITITDAEKFQEYLTKTQIVAKHYGAQMMFRGKLNSVLNGQAKDHSIVVAVRFPDAEKLNSWFHSTDYQALIPLRDASSIQIMTAYDGLD